MIANLAAHIVNAATQHFARHGYAGATTRHIASDVGVDIATLYYHYKTKALLLSAVLAPLLLAQRDAITDASNRTDVDDRRRVLVGRLLEITATDPDRVKVGTDASISAVPDMAHAIASMDEALIAGLCGPRANASTRDGARAALAAIRGSDPARLASPRVRENVTERLVRLIGA